MRLLDVVSLEIQSGFNDAAAALTDEEQAQRKLWDMEQSEPSNTIPPYAILSHRWVGQEVVFQDFGSVAKDKLRRLASANPVPQTSNGGVENVGQGSEASAYKIAGACAQVRSANTGIRHIWIDTICINKGDSRELSSALNSMFKWYHNAAVCYVYLFDVRWNAAAGPTSNREQFVQSKWFRRGWTLQELLAPKKVEFFDRDWQYIGSKEKLVDYIAEATGISKGHLLGDFRTASIAQKMNWLSRRTTSIIEDRAYCMLGLFDVFLEPRYGQGADEFLRLQREIFERFSSNGVFDESLFAWTADVIETSGLLAPAPSCFRNSGNVIFDQGVAKTRQDPAKPEPGMRIDTTYKVDLHVPWSARNHQGAIQAAHFLTLGTVTLSYALAHSATRRSKSEHLMNLNCWTRGPGQKLQTVRIKVVQDKDKTWRRVECDKLFESSNADLYHQFDVHGNAGRAFFPHRIKYKA